MNEDDYNRFIELQQQEYRRLYRDIDIDIDIDETSLTGISNQVGNIHIKKNKATNNKSTSKKKTISKKKKDTWMRVFLIGIGNGMLGGLVLTTVGILKNIFKNNKSALLF